MSKAPGFMIGNVIVMAGVPIIMHAMLDAAAPRLRTGARVLVETIEAEAIPEGRYAKDLAALAARFEEVSIGSYPHFSSAGVRNQIVLRARDASKLGAAAAATREMISRLTNNGAKV
jgi:molybdopterin-biosynthesis enzyme MoeA-like protein